jgi:hypothetical protein
MEDEEVVNHIYNPIEVFDEEVNDFFEANKTPEPQTIFDTQEGIDQYMFQMQKYNTRKKEYNEDDKYDYINNRKRAQHKLNVVQFGGIRPDYTQVETDHLEMDNKVRVGIGEDSVVLHPRKDKNGAIIRDKTRYYMKKQRFNKDRIGYQTAPVRDDKHKNANWEKLASVHNPRLRGIQTRGPDMSQEAISNNRNKVHYNSLNARESRRFTIDPETMIKKCKEGITKRSKRNSKRDKKDPSNRGRITAKITELPDETQVARVRSKDGPTKRKDSKIAQEWDDPESMKPSKDKIKKKKNKLPKTSTYGLPVHHIKFSDLDSMFECCEKINNIDRHIQNKANIIKHKPIEIAPEIYENTDRIQGKKLKQPKFDRAYAGRDMRPSDIKMTLDKDVDDINTPSLGESRRTGDRMMISKPPKGSRPVLTRDDFDVEPDLETGYGVKSAKKRKKEGREDIPKHRLHKMLGKDAKTCAYEEITKKREHGTPLDKGKFRDKKMKWAEEAAREFATPNTDMERTSMHKWKNPNTRKTRDSHTKLEEPDDTNVETVITPTKKFKPSRGRFRYSNA